MNSKGYFMVVLGVLFVVCGLSLVAMNLLPGAEKYLALSIWWPMFIVAPGLALWFTYIMSSERSKSWAVLIPANILLFTGLTMFANTIVARVFDYHTIWAWTVFMYPGSVAIGFWVAWLASGREKALAIPAVILTIMSGLLLCFMTFVLLLSGQGQNEVGKFLWPLMMVLFGLLVLLSPLWGAVFKDKNGKWAGKTEKEWEAWGENLGQRIEKSVNKAVGEDDVLEGEEIDKQ